MRKSLIAIAAAGTLACGIAGAQSYDAPHAATPYVQYDARDGYPGNDGRWVRYQDVLSSPAVDEREARIARRIERGVETGRLTRREAWRIHRQLEDVVARERAFMADGRLARWEERELMRDLDRLAWNLRTQMRDEDRSY